MSETEQQTDQHKPLMTDQHYNLLIMGLLIVIIITLAGLWSMEWGRRKRAEDDLVKYMEQNRKLQQLGGLLPAGTDIQNLLSTVQPESRAALPDRSSLEKVDWDGSKKQVLVLDPRTAEILGFAPGDVIWVRPASPESSPAENK